MLFSYIKQVFGIRVDSESHKTKILWERELISIILQHNWRQFVVYLTCRLHWWVCFLCWCMSVRGQVGPPWDRGCSFWRLRQHLRLSLKGFLRQKLTLQLPWETESENMSILYIYGCFVFHQVFIQVCGVYQVWMQLLRVSFDIFVPNFVRELSVISKKYFSI